ncbi:hypothetical protein BD311DRAFT_757622 [Dichomitus squalens]|uniref:Uncharacterized protein n=1 Tax=Dichomitus squalens TaxID=114155 RepID=A0A4Q9MMV5_9APHY|nr:hypothetical protein BD311DRAFT_757622 [Dichomitus squalens]
MLLAAPSSSFLLHISLKCSLHDCPYSLLVVDTVLVVPCVRSAWYSSSPSARSNERVNSPFTDLPFVPPTLIIPPPLALKGCFIFTVRTSSDGLREWSLPPGKFKLELVYLMICHAFLRRILCAARQHFCAMSHSVSLYIPSPARPTSFLLLRRPSPRGFSSSFRAQ